MAAKKSSVKRATVESDPVPKAIVRALTSLGNALGLPPPEGDVTFANGIVSVHRKGTVITGALSAPRTLVVAIWGKEPRIVERVFTVPVGQWDPVRQKLQCNETVQADWLALVDAVRATSTDGALEEAQLLWLHVDDFANTNRRSPRFKSLFATLPPVAKIDSAGSEAAFVERLLPFLGNGSTLEQLIAALGVLDSIVDARRDVEGQRREKLLATYARAIDALGTQQAPALREITRLLRMQQV